MAPASKRVAAAGRRALDRIEAPARLEVPDFFEPSARVPRLFPQIIGAPHYVMNFQQEFQAHVIDYFCSEYLRGRTPHPCLACNDKIKFDFLLEVHNVVGRADDLAHAAGVLHVVQGAAAPGLAGTLRVRLLVVPQLHGHTHNLVTLVLQKARGNGGVHSSAHGYNHLAFAHQLQYTLNGRFR